MSPISSARDVAWLLACSLFGAAGYVNAQVLQPPEPVISPFLQPPEPVISPSITVTVLAQHGVKQVQPSVGRYDLGLITLAGTGVVSCSFVLRNDNRFAVTVDRLQPSCGCTRASIHGHADDKKAITLLPHKALRVDVSVNQSALAVGYFEKSVTVGIQGQSVPAAVLELAGSVQKAASTNPKKSN